MTKKRRWLAAATIALILGVAVYTVLLLRRGFSTRTEPSALEVWIARSARGLATPSGAKSLANPIPKSPEAIREGMRHFADHCAMCHANNGSGDTEIGRSLYPKAPDMRAAPTQSLSDGELYYIIQNGIRLTGMPGWGDPNDQQSRGSWHLVHFIRHLPSLSETEIEQMRRWNPVPPPDPEERSEEDAFLSGGDGHQHEHKH